MQCTFTAMNMYHALLVVVMVMCASVVMGAVEPTSTAVANTTDPAKVTEAMAGDCAEPNNAHYGIELAEKADIVVSGLAVSMGPGAPACAAANASTADATSSGPDMLIQQSDSADGSQVLLFYVQCVHKGALVCRRNAADAATTPPRCIIAVKVPAQTAEAGQLPPCTVTRGFRYTLLLSSKAAASCDGVYNLHNERITDSIRTHVGLQSCAPYPTWPSQNTSITGDGLAHVLGASCQSATDTKAVQCTGADDPCTGKAACGEDTAIACVPKACVGRYMMHSLLTGVDPCQPVFISKVTGLPVQSCQVTATRLARQARQAEKRLSTTTPSATDGSATQDSSSGGQQPMRLGSVLGGGSRLQPLPTLNSGIKTASDNSTGH